MEISFIAEGCPSLNIVNKMKGHNAFNGNKARKEMTRGFVTLDAAPHPV